MSVTSWPALVTKRCGTYTCTLDSSCVVAACSNAWVDAQGVALKMSNSRSTAVSARERRGEVQRAGETRYGSSVLALDVGAEPWAR